MLAPGVWIPDAQSSRFYPEALATERLEQGQHPFVAAKRAHP
jgi:hypothetical protein